MALSIELVQEGIPLISNFQVQYCDVNVEGDIPFLGGCIIFTYDVPPGIGVIVEAPGSSNLSFNANGGLAIYAPNTTGEKRDFTITVKSDTLSTNILTETVTQTNGLYFSDFEIVYPAVSSVGGLPFNDLFTIRYRGDAGATGVAIYSEGGTTGSTEINITSQSSNTVFVTSSQHDLSGIAEGTQINFILAPDSTQNSYFAEDIDDRVSIIKQ